MHEGVKQALTFYKVKLSQLVQKKFQVGEGEYFYVFDMIVASFSTKIFVQPTTAKFAVPA